MTLTVQATSFGIQYRPIIPAQLVLDARVLDNPARIDRLRPLTGLDLDVADYVLRQPLAHQLLSGATIVACAEIVGALTRNENQVVLAVYCTGGKHRSVAVVEDLLRRLRLSFPDRSLIGFSSRHLDITSGRMPPHDRTDEPSPAST